jgi:hypothetical protein
LWSSKLNDNEYSLEELLAGVTKENLHSEVDTGDNRFYEKHKNSSYRVVIKLQRAGARAAGHR